MTTHEVLVRARALIEREEDWACGFGQLGEGRLCALNALDKAAGGNDDCWLPCQDVLCAVTGHEGVLFSFNDTHTHAEVLAAFDKAIAATAPDPDTSFLNEVRVEEPVSA